MAGNFIKYKRGAVTYECKESKFRQEVSVKFVIKWAQAGDWICYPLSEDGKRGTPFIAQPKEFYTTFVEVDDGS